MASLGQEAFAQARTNHRLAEGGRPRRRSGSTQRPLQPSYRHSPSVSRSGQPDLTTINTTGPDCPSASASRPPPSPAATTFSAQAGVPPASGNAHFSPPVAQAQCWQPTRDHHDPGLCNFHSQQQQQLDTHSPGPPVQRQYQGPSLARLAPTASSSSLRSVNSSYRSGSQASGSLEPPLSNTRAHRAGVTASQNGSQLGHFADGSQISSHVGGSQVGSQASNSFAASQSYSVHPAYPVTAFPRPTQQPAGPPHFQTPRSPSPVDDPYDILSAYATDSNADGESEINVAVHPQEPARYEPPLVRRPAPWAYKPRVGQSTGLQSAVEATAAPAKPMGLKHEESSAPTAFIVDGDFERVVQEIVPNMDHPETPSLTFRVFLLGIFFNIALAFANTIFSFRSNPFTLTPYVGILLAYPMGKFLEHYVPAYTWYTRWFTVSLNPGPFTVKEHVLIGIWATTGASGAYGTANIVVQKLFYHINLGPLSYIAFLVCLNLIGFGLSGLLRSWVIRPIQMIWPSVLPFVSLYSAFHGGLKRDPTSDSDSIIDPKHKSKLRYFSIVVAACFIYHIVGPQYMSPGLPSIPLLCLFFSKTNFFWRTVVGSQVTGVGAFALALDWSVIGSLSMSVPFWSTVSSTIGTIALQWIATPISSYYNWFDAPPVVRYHVNSVDIFDGAGTILEPETLIKTASSQGVEVDWGAFDKRKPFHMTGLFSLAYFASMAQFMSAFVHCIVWYGKDVYQRLRGVDKIKEGLDMHCLLIDQYPEVPLWLYLVLLVVTSAGAVVVFQFTAMAMPWYMTLLSIGFSAVACFPIALILATTGVQLYLNVVSQFILGLLLPGFPIVQMAFKSLAVSVGQQCMTLLTDLKLGHYMKVPPRHVFITQVSASIVSAVASYLAVVLWLTPEQHRLWILEGRYLESHEPGFNWKSTSNRTFYSASIIWGLIGPRRFFFETQYGAVIIWGLAFGALTPIIIKMFDLVSGKYIPWKYVQGPLLFSGLLPGSDTSYVFSCFLVALWSQFFMYRYRTNWWKRYNYITACALDVGVALAAFMSVFVLQGFGFDFPMWALNPRENKELSKNLAFCSVHRDSVPLDMLQNLERVRKRKARP